MNIKMVKYYLIISLFSVFFIPAAAFTENDVYFSPTAGSQDEILREIKNASRSIDVAMYYLTTKETIRELVLARGRGASIRFLLDDSKEADPQSKSEDLIRKGFEVRYYTGLDLVHNKFAIIDSRVLITGSFYWSPTENEKNDNSLLVITDPGVIDKYQERFEFLWEKGRKGELKKAEPARAKRK